MIVMVGVVMIEVVIVEVVMIGVVMVEAAMIEAAMVGAAMVGAAMVGAAMVGAAMIGVAMIGAAMVVAVMVDDSGSYDTVGYTAKIPNPYQKNGMVSDPTHTIPGYGMVSLDMEYSMEYIISFRLVDRY